MKRALAAWLARAADGGDRHACAVAAAEAVAERPWDVVHQAGLLARCTVGVAERDLALGPDLRVVRVDAANAVARVDRGQPYPALDGSGRKSRGAFDTPVEMARRVVAATLAAVDGSARVGLDPACGTGAFLLAMAEAGVPEVHGTDLDPTALAVARIAVPKARTSVEDALTHGPTVDLVCGNPPFVPPERQDKALRAELRRRFPWLHGRFDLVVPFAAAAAERVRTGGGLGLVLPAPSLVQPYGTSLRQRWLRRHTFTEISGPHPFPGAQVDVALVVLRADTGPSPLPPWGVDPEEVLGFATAPISSHLRPGDAAIAAHVRARSVRLGDVALVDTGLVAHSAAGGKGLLIREEPAEGLVPYADARDFFAGRGSWLVYDPTRMHRAKRPEMFEPPKIVVQRIRGRGPVRAAIDRDGVYVGHTCTVVVPTDPRVPLERLLEIVCSPLADGLSRIEKGERLDLYPRDLADFPVPTAWLAGSTSSLEEALGLDAAQRERLVRAAGG